MFDYRKVASAGLGALAIANSVDPAWAEFPDGKVAKFTLGAGVAYDDNLFRLQSNKEGDTIFTLNAGAALNKDISRQNFQLAGNIIQQLYTSNSNFNATLFNFGGTWNWRVGNQFSGEIGYVQNQYPNTFLEITSRTPNKRTVGIPFASIGYQFLPSWEIRGRYEFVDITNSAQQFKVSDLEENRYEGALRYKTEFGNLVDLFYRFSDGKRPNVAIDPAGNVGQYEQNDIGVNVARWELTGRSRFSGFVAYTDRSYELAPSRDFSGPTWNLTYTYLPTGSTSVALSVYRLIGVYTDVTANYIVTTGVTLAPTWQATSKLAFGMNAYYQDRDYQGNPGIVTGIAGQEKRNDDLYSVGVNATYAILRTLKATLYYTWTKRDSNLRDPTTNAAFLNFTDNIVGAGVEWQF